MADQNPVQIVADLFDEAASALVTTIKLRPGSGATLLLYASHVMIGATLVFTHRGEHDARRGILDLVKWFNEIATLPDADIIAALEAKQSQIQEGLTHG